MLGRSIYYSPLGRIQDTAVGSAICLFLAIIAAIILFIVFLPSKNESKYNGLLLWAHRALNFKTMFSLSLLKFLYLLSVCFISIFGLYMLFTSFFAGIGVLVVGNLVTRIIYEFFILVFSIHENLSQINTNTSFLRGKAGNAGPVGAAPVVQNTQQSSQQQPTNYMPQDNQPSNTYTAQQQEHNDRLPQQNPQNDQQGNPLQ